MTERLILIGGGEHARVVADAAATSSKRFELLGFVDSNPDAKIAGLSHLGDDAAVDDYQPALGVIAVGTLDSSDSRREIAGRLTGRLSGWASVVHAASWVSPRAEVEEGAVVMAGCVVQAGARIGRHAIINSGSVVEHDVEIGAFAVLAPGVVVGGGTAVEEGAILGLRASVRDHITIGRFSMVGMGSVVVEDVEPGTTVMGNPASVGDQP